MQQLIAVLILLTALGIGAQGLDYADLMPEYFSKIEHGYEFNDRIDNQQYEFRVINRKSEKGVKVKVEGSWQKHGAYYQFSSGTLKKKTLYNFGEKHGKEEIFWTGTNRPRKTIDWRDGKKDGVEIQYFKSGIKMEYMSYSGGQKNGKAHWYDTDGSLSTERHYVDDVQHGLMKHYDKGRLTHTQQFVNGKGGKTIWAN